MNSHPNGDRGIVDALRRNYLGFASRRGCAENARGDDLGEARLPGDYETILGTPLQDTEAKHIPRDASFPVLEQLLTLATRVGYPYPFMGQHQGLTAEGDRRYVEGLVLSGSFRPLKFVVTSDGRIWADNTHWTFVALIRYGLGTRIRDVPSYVIDLRQSEPILIDAPRTLLGRARVLAIDAAVGIETRVQLGWRPPGVSFRLRDLLHLGGYVS